jgi:hypothetical protein
MHRTLRRAYKHCHKTQAVELSGPQLLYYLRRRVRMRDGASSREVEKCRV